MGRMVALLAVAASLIAPVADAAAADSGWIGPNQAGHLANSLRRQGAIPVSVECRNDSARPDVVRPAVRLRWRENGERRNWSVVLTSESYEMRPGWPPEWKLWTRISGNRLKGASGRTAFSCTLWHSKASGDVGVNAPVTSRFSQKAY